LLEALAQTGERDELVVVLSEPAGVGDGGLPQR
jgi:hypothetical protein